MLSPRRGGASRGNDWRVTMKNSGTRRTPSIQSLGRGLTILEAVAASGEPVPLKDLTALLGIDRSSVFRLATTLERHRFLAVAPGGADYVLGPSVWRLSRKCGQNMLTSLCREQLRKLSVETGETAHLAVREGTFALFIDHCTPNARVVTVLGQTGELVPLHCSAHGKALIADMTAAQLAVLFGSTKLPARTKRTIGTVGRLAKACARITAQGVSFDEGEDVDELRCVAAPIRDQDGTIVASIGISAPVTRFPQSRWAPVSLQVADAAHAVARTLTR
jgi:IclR family transcriptional regulator, acetate operon repressor